MTLEIRRLNGKMEQVGKKDIAGKMSLFNCTELQRSD